METKASDVQGCNYLVKTPRRPGNATAVARSVLVLLAGAPWYHVPHAMPPWI